MKLQSQVAFRRPIRLHQVRQQAPPGAAMQFPGASGGFATAQPLTGLTLKPHPVIPATFAGQQASSSQGHEQAVIFAPNINFQVVRPATTIAPRFFTVRQEFAERQPGPLN